MKRPRPQKSAEVRGHGTKPEAVRERAILALMSERSIAAAAERAGVNERTLRRWMAEDEAFQRELMDARRAVFDAGMARVQALTAEAVETLAVLMRENVSDNVRLGAARTVAEIGVHQRDAETILARLDEIDSIQRQRQSEGF